MSFLQHAAAHGLLIRHLIADGTWHRCPTTDHPKRKNGAYAYNGRTGAVQNWATMERVALYRPEAAQDDPVSFRRMVRESLAAERARRAQAREQAIAMLAESRRGRHPYLRSKGFPEVRGFVHPSGDLLVPMRDFEDYTRVNSLQRIAEDGGKLFLPGGKAAGSVYIVGEGHARERWLCEGYATALSVHAALTDLRRLQVQVICCFSAGNLQRVATMVKRPAFVMADHDESGTGAAAARGTGLPWIMPDEVGTDANDLHQRQGLRALVRLIQRVGK